MSSSGVGLHGQKCRELTEDEQRRLVVEWGKPTIVERRLGDYICLPAKTFLINADESSREPIKESWLPP